MTKKTIELKLFFESKKIVIFVMVYQSTSTVDDTVRVDSTIRASGCWNWFVARRETLILQRHAHLTVGVRLGIEEAVEAIVDRSLFCNLCTIAIVCNY